MKLVYATSQGKHATGDTVEVGDIVKTFRGEPVEVVTITEPHKPGSTGRINVKFFEETHPSREWVVSGRTGEFFPGVIDAEWIERGGR